jgi:hypothetical protein
MVGHYALICPLCAATFSICFSCWRGHKYCCEFCTYEARRRSRCASQKKYNSTIKGQESHFRRQRTLRLKNIETDHSSKVRKIPVMSQRPSFWCKVCCVQVKHINEWGPWNFGQLIRWREEIRAHGGDTS